MWDPTADGHIYVMVSHALGLKVIGVARKRVLDLEHRLVTRLCIKDSVIARVRPSLFL